MILGLADPRFQPVGYTRCGAEWALRWRKIDWNFINSFSGWLSAIGTLSAVLVSLWLARRDQRIRLRVNAGIRKIFFERKIYERPEREPDFLVIAVTNVGRRVVTVTGLLWKNTLLQRRYLFQMPGEAPLSAQFPARLQDGDGADFVVPLSELAKNPPAEIKQLIPRPRRLTVYFLRILVRTSTGELVAAPLDTELKKWLLAFIGGKTDANKVTPSLRNKDGAEGL
ncbi:MAG: hypothetical protein WA005_08440 [Candidatus Binataceae bacterium]